jgi:hypothetical protein
MPVLAYLDQTHLSRLSEDEFTTLRVWVDSGRLVVPTSEIHMIETIKWRNAGRFELVRRATALRQRYVLVPEVLILALEWYESRGVAHAVREHMVAQQPSGDRAWLGAPADGLELASEVLDDEAAEAVRAQGEESFGEVAANIDRLRQVPLSHVRDQIIEGLSLLAAAGAIPGNDLPGVSDLPLSEEAFAAVFPSVGLRRYFYASAHSLEPNDLADLSFICRTVPHFDVVAVDRRMHDRLHAIRRKVPAPMAEVLVRARVVRSVLDAITVIEECLNASASQNSGGV